MIKFDTINGQLCRMLEKAVPLTEDAKFPCVVRLIQDSSPMGRYNNRLTDKCLLPFICVGIDNKGDMERMENAPRFGHECYELLGYPVVPNSAEWALYQMQQGKRVCRKCWQYNDHDVLSNYGIDNDTVYAYLGYDKGFNPNQQGKWLQNTTVICNARDGWQLYEPKPEPAVGVGVAKLNRALDVLCNKLEQLACPPNANPHDGQPCNDSDDCVNCWREYALAEAEEEK